MEYIYDYILENWPNLAGTIIYLIIFLPIIFLNICTVIIIIFSPFIISIIPLIPERYIKSIILNKNHDNLEKLGFSIGRNIRKLQKYLTDEYPFILIRKIAIMSIQKKLLELYIAIYEAAINGFISGIKTGREINEKDKSTWEHWNIYKKIINYPIFVISTFLISLVALIMSSILILPTIVFILIIISVI